MKTLTLDTKPVYHIPGVCQGQIVEVAYALIEDGGLLRRTTDRSDGTVSLRAIRDVWAEATDGDAVDEWEGWQPWGADDVPGWVRDALDEADEVSVRVLGA
mgnify:CR=1 FL=1